MPTGSTKIVNVALTVAEARALSRAAGNTTSALDMMEAVFPTKQQRTAARRAHEKLDAEIRAVRGWDDCREGREGAGQ